MKERMLIVSRAFLVHLIDCVLGGLLRSFFTEHDETAIIRHWLKKLLRQVDQERAFGDR
jgi:hypothetical protein